ncbi:MAG: hypothetical protein ACR2N3_13035 [Pyrinomonadaceae bacterium]
MEKRPLVYCLLKKAAVSTFVITAGSGVLELAKNNFFKMRHLDLQISQKPLSFMYFDLSKKSVF